MTLGASIKPGPEGTTIEVLVKPRARKSAVLGIKEGAVVVAVAAIPAEGAANEELVRTLAAFFGLGRRAVRLVAGASARHKRILLAGVESSDVASRLQRIG
jgi:uncharacterized protein (TIGR00251 family)